MALTCQFLRKRICVWRHSFYVIAPKSPKLTKTFRPRLKEWLLQRVLTVHVRCELRGVCKRRVPIVIVDISWVGQDPCPVCLSHVLHNLIGEVTLCVSDVEAFALPVPKSRAEGRKEGRGVKYQDLHWWQLAFWRWLSVTPTAPRAVQAHTCSAQQSPHSNLGAAL